jgi:hypothetical protein
MRSRFCPFNKHDDNNKMSSAEEESIKRQSYKKQGKEDKGQQQHDTDSVPIRRRKPPLSSSSSSSSSTRTYSTELPSTQASLPAERVHRLQLKQLSELFSQHAYMKQSAESGRPVCAIAAQKSDLSHTGRHRMEHDAEEDDEEEGKVEVRAELSSLRHTAERIATLHTQQLDANPWQSHGFQEARASVCTPTYFLDTDDSRQVDTKTIQQQLSEKRLELVIQTAQHESELLGQAGDFGGYRYPPCVNGAEGCVAAKGTLPGMTEPGVVLMGFMFKDEYTEFRRTKRVPYPGQRPCVLCCRCLPVRLTLEMRSLMMQGGEGLLRPDQAFEKKPVQIVQCYRNLENVVGGYYKEYMFHPQPNEPIIDPIVKLALQMLRAYKDSTNRWMVDQSPLVFDKATAPRPAVGESLNSF